jgi:hypothetical protein
MSEYVYAGVDPGKYGAIAVVNKRAVLEIHDFPLDGKQPDLEKLARILTGIGSRYAYLEAVIEDVGTYSHDGRRGAFTFGENKGFWKLGLTMIGIDPQVVKVEVWKKCVLGRVHHTDKETSIKTAKLLFPNSAEWLRLKKHDGRADAILLAEYARRVAVARSLAAR